VLVCALLAALLVWLARPVAPGDGAQRLTRAELVDLGPPSGLAGARTLPLHWDLQAGGRATTVELRLRFERPTRPPGSAQEPWAVVVPRLGNAWTMDINGHALASGGELERANDAWAARRPVRVMVPDFLLQPDNELRIRIRADKGRRAGLSAVWVGPEDDLQALWQREEWVRVILPQAVTVLSLLVAGLCALLWLQQRDPLYAWAALGEAAWGLRLVDTWWEQTWLDWPVALVPTLVLFWIWTAALYRMIATLWDDRRPRAEGRLVAAVLLGGPLLLAVSWVSGYSQPLVLWMLASSLLWIGLAARLWWDCRRQPAWPRVLVTLALTLCVAAITRDLVAGRSAVELYEESAWNKYAGMTLALAVLVIVSLRFKQARDALVALNRSIGERLAAREAELNQRHAELTALAQAKAAAEERGRILRDMHDGAGAHLIAAIRQVESGQAQDPELLQTLQESLDQLRLSIDAMNIPPGDVNALLSSLRYRLERRIEAAGLRLVWRVDELPLLPGLHAEGMRHLQFILLEAISNVIQHARATRLTVRAVPDGEGLRIDLEDDGVGCNPAPDGGHGLRSMAERAALIGATLSLSPRDKGTLVSLLLAR
jgi:signal transduction histidine kinase